MTPPPHVVLTVCRDEEDVIATFVRFYLKAGFDLVHVVDNASADRTAERVEALIAEGLPVRLTRDPRLGYERYLSEHFHAVGRVTGADWLFFLDADEFILFPSPVRDYLAVLPTEVDCLRLRQKEMYPQPGTAGEHPSGFLLTPRSEPRYNDTTKDVTRYRPDARVQAGKHRIDFRGRQAIQPDDLVIRHYKYRSPQQAQRKEANRVRAQTSYTDAELADISAFGVARSRAWFEECARRAERQAWRRSFDPDLPAVEDRALARWVERHLIGGVVS